MSKRKKIELTLSPRTRELLSALLEEQPPPEEVPNERSGVTTVRTVSLYPETDAMLAHLMLDLGTNRSDVVTRAVKRYYDRVIRKGKNP